jgi:hypothetical protein
MLWESTVAKRETPRLRILPLESLKHILIIVYVLETFKIFFHAGTLFSFFAYEISRVKSENDAIEKAKVH